MARAIIDNRIVRNMISPNVNVLTCCAVMSSCVSDEAAGLLVLSVNVAHILVTTLDDCSLCSILFIDFLIC